MVIQSLRAVMDTPAYDYKHQQLTLLYGDVENNDAAIAKRDQAFALLYDESGWTQQQLADREGKGHVWVSYRLRFARFIKVIHNFTTVKSSTNLTEGRFRAYWIKTDKNDLESARFDHVVRMLRDPDAAPPPKARAPKLVEVVEPVLAPVAEPVVQAAVEPVEPVTNVVALDVSMLSRTAQERYASLERRLRSEIDMVVNSKVQAATEKFVQDTLMPFYRKKLEDAEMILARPKPFTSPEFVSLLRSLHPDSSSPEYRHLAFILLKDRDMLLRPLDRPKKLTGTLPGTLEELLARKEAIAKRRAKQRKPATDVDK